MVQTTKRGQMDNVATYEHICDTIADLETIDPKLINLGSVAIVLDDDGKLTVYMASSDKQWHLIG